MEAEERPSKLRKLETNGEAPTEEANVPLLLDLTEAANDSGNAPSSNSKPPQATANLAGRAAEQAEAPEEDVSDEEPGPKNKPHHHDPDPAEHERLLLQQQQNGELTKPISKSQLKKLRKREEWEAGRDYRKVKRKQKTQERKARKREAREEEQEEEAQRLQLQMQTVGGQDQNDEEVSKALSKPQNPQSSKVKRGRTTRLPITILIDCSFDSLMMEKERISLGSQITRAYSDNHRAPYQAHLVISSWGGLLKDRFETVLKNHYLNWKGVRFEQGDFVEAAGKMEKIMRDPKEGGRLVGCFKRFAPLGENGKSSAEEEVSKDETHAAEPSSAPEETTSPNTNGHPQIHDNSPPLNPESAQHNHQASGLLSDTNPSTSSHQPLHPKGETIYLTSDSPHTLTTLSPYSTYIIGGLVDKNRHKGICYKTACKQNIKTAKLPIGEFLEMSSRKVLATNHVVEILLRWLEEAAGGREEGAWGRAFLRVIPKRKGGILRGGPDAEGEGDGEDDDGPEEEEGGKMDDNAIDNERESERADGEITIGEEHEYGKEGGTKPGRIYPL
jgi:tRNA (guanine9-N1)-methyltransferase